MRGRPFKVDTPSMRDVPSHFTSNGDSSTVFLDVGDRRGRTVRNADDGANARRGAGDFEFDLVGQSVLVSLLGKGRHFGDFGLFDQ